MIETPSRFVVRVLGVKTPKGQVLRQLPASAHRFCAMCGGPMQAGDPCIAVGDLRKSFTNQPSLLGGSHICESCVLLCEGPFLKGLAHAVVTEDGLFRFSKTPEVAYWMANPPKTPYLMVKSTAKAQHVYWRAQMSLPGDVGQLCVGGSNHLIRYPRLHKAWAMSRAFVDRIAAEKASARTRTAAAAIHVPSGLIQGSYENNYTFSLNQSASPEEAAAVSALNPGEQWALFRVQSKKPADLVRPEQLIQGVQA